MMWYREGIREFPRCTRPLASPLTQVSWDTSHWRKKKNLTSASIFARQRFVQTEKVETTFSGSRVPRVLDSTFKTMTKVGGLQRFCPYKIQTRLLPDVLPHTIVESSDSLCTVDRR